MNQQAFRFVIVGLPAISLLFLGNGCASFDPLGDYLDHQQYKSDVKRYERKGYEPERARRAAFEDQFFRDMQNDRW